MRVGQGDHHLLLPVCAPQTSTTRHTAHLFGRWEHEEGVTLRTEVKVLAKAASHQELRVSLQFQQIVLRLPHEGHRFELAKASLVVAAPSVLHCAHIVEDQLFAPLDHTLDYIETQHSERVQDVDALIE